MSPPKGEHAGENPLNGKVHGVEKITVGCPRWNAMEEALPALGVPMEQVLTERFDMV